MTTHYSSLVEAGNGGGFVFAGITLFLMESEGGGGESVVAKIVPGGLSKNYYRLPANEGIIRISLCLMGRSSKFNSDTTKILQTPPPPLTPANQATKNDRSLSAHRPWFTRDYLKLG